MPGWCLPVDLCYSYDTGWKGKQRVETYSIVEPSVYAYHQKCLSYDIHIHKLHEAQTQI
jgi:hypothetical protein